MYTEQLRIETEEIKLAKNRFIGDVLREHNLKPNEVNIEQLPHNNKINIYHNGFILGRFYTEDTFTTVDEDVVIKTHRWILSKDNYKREIDKL